MTESGTGRILPSAAPGTFIAAPVLTPSVISPRHHPYPFLFPLLYWHESHFFFRRPSRRRVDFTGANVGGRACSLRFEVHFLQILPCRGKSNWQEKTSGMAYPAASPCTVKPEAAPVAGCRTEGKEKT